MKAWLLLILTLTAAFGIVAAVPAQCGTVGYRAPAVVVKEKVVVAEVVPVAVFQAIPVFVPTFQVGYTPYAPPAYAPPQPPAASAPGMADVLGEIRRIGQRLDTIERTRPAAAAQSPSPQQVMPKAADPAPVGPQSAAPAAAPGGTALAVYQTKCAACHQAGKETLGGGFVLLDQAGARVALNDKQQSKMMKKTYKKLMPPEGNDQGIPQLTDDELSLIVYDMKN